MAYVYDDKHIMGFLGSHQPTIWMGDYGYVSVMPQVGETVKVLPEDRKMSFNHKDEKASPHYYSVTLTDNLVVFRIYFHPTFYGVQAMAQMIAPIVQGRVQINALDD